MCLAVIKPKPQRFLVGIFFGSLHYPSVNRIFAEIAKMKSLNLMKALRKIRVS